MTDFKSGARPPAVGDADFKAAMRKLAATVTLVTTSDGGSRHGMLATAVTALSADPPSLLVCINRSASMHGPTKSSRRLCVNMLAQNQAWLFTEFGLRSGSDRFSVGEWLVGPHGLPYVADSAAAVFCTVDDQLDYGTHTIFVARIDATEIDGAQAPLVYQAGSMGRFAAFPSTSQQAVSS